MTSSDPNADTKSGDGRMASSRNKLNDLTAREWVAETVSVWRQKGLGAKHPDTQIERLHPAPFSYTDVARLIRFFTKSRQTVLDPFVGIGSTLKAAATEGRRGIGIELSEYFAQLARERLHREIDSSSTELLDQRVIQGDARDVLPELESDSVEFVVTSPPYWRILHKRDHKVRQERQAKGLATRYSEADPRDLGNIEDYDHFLRELAAVFAECGRVLKPRRYVAIIAGDFRDGGMYRMFHADLANAIAQVDLVLKGMTILHQPYKRVFPYGYPSAYVPNIHHQYIIIARNEKS